MELKVGLGPAASDVIAASGKDVVEELELAGVVYGAFNLNLVPLLIPVAAATAYRADSHRSVIRAR